MRPGDPKVVVSVMQEALSIARLPADAELPDWINGDSWCSVTRTPDELSVVCASRLVPREVQSAGPWRALQVAGPLDFALTGILNRLSNPLARAGISIFAVSTYDTDYVLVREKDVEQAVACLTESGIVVRAGN